MELNWRKTSLYFLVCTVNKSMKNLITIALITAGQVKRNRIQNRLQNSVQPARIPMLLPHVTEARDTASQRLLVFAFPSLIVTGIGWLKPLQIWLLHSYYGRVNICFFFPSAFLPSGLQIPAKMFQQQWDVQTAGNQSRAVNTERNFHFLQHFLFLQFCSIRKILLSDYIFKPSLPYIFTHLKSSDAKAFSRCFQWNIVSCTGSMLQNINLETVTNQTEQISIAFSWRTKHTEVLLKPETRGTPRASSCNCPNKVIHFLSQFLFLVTGDI